jgi:hypothetical protein
MIELIELSFGAKFMLVLLFPFLALGLAYFCEWQYNHCLDNPDEFLIQVEDGVEQTENNKLD